MPFSMDIHKKVDGATDDAAAAAHRRDLETQKKCGIGYQSHFIRLNILLFIILLITSCAPRVQDVISASPNLAIAATPDPLVPLQYDRETWLPGAPPDSSWRVRISPSDIARLGVLQSYIQNDWAGKYSLTFKDGNYVMTWQDLQGNTGEYRAKYDVDRYVVRLTYSTLTDEDPREVDYFLWRIDGNELHTHLLGVENASFGVRMAIFDSKVWTRVD